MKKLFLLLGIVTQSLFGTLISNVSIAGNATSTGINTSGATLLTAYLVDGDAGVAPALSDSKGNSWTLAVTGQDLYFYYACTALSVGAGHTFTISAGGGLNTANIQAWSGFTCPHDKTSISGHNFASTIQPGSITPSANGELLVTGLYTANTMPPFTINSGFTVLVSIPGFTGGFGNGMAVAYLEQMTAAAINPTWTLGSASFIQTAIFSFPVNPVGTGASQTNVF